MKRKTAYNKGLAKVAVKEKVILGIAVLLIITSNKGNSQEKVLKIFNQQFSTSLYYRNGIFTKLSAYTPNGKSEYIRLIGINAAYTESVYKRYTVIGNLISGNGEYEGWQSFYKDGKYLGANQPTINKELFYLHVDVVYLIHRKDTLIDKLNDNLHVKRVIDGLRLGILYRHHAINDAVNADADTGDNSTKNSGSAPTGSISDDGTQWGAAYYSAADNTGRVMPGPALRYMPPSSSNIFIPSLSVGYGLIKYIDNYIPKDDHKGLKVVNCPPVKASGHRKFINYYADLLIGYPYVQPYKDVNGNKHYFTPGKSIGYTREYVGFRIGCEYNYGRKRNITTKVELARYPDLRTYYNYDHLRYLGYNYNNLCYINVRLGIGLFRESKHTLTRMGQGEYPKKEFKNN